MPALISAVGLSDSTGTYFTFTSEESKAQQDNISFFFFKHKTFGLAKQIGCSDLKL